MGFFDFTTKILGVKGAKDTLVDGVSGSFKNLKKLTEANRASKTNNDIDYDKFYNESLSGKLRFRQRMVDEGLSEKRYSALNQKQYNYSIVIMIFSILFLAYSIFMIFNGSAMIALIAILMILTVYSDTLRKAAEIREQSFITFKEFITSPNLWFPTTKRVNDYFSIENEEQVNHLLDEIEKLQITEEDK
mgnify:FL=1